MTRPVKLVILDRDVTRDECHWLERDFKAGEQLYIYYGYTYGCISHKGIACTETEGFTPFFEIPRDALI
jgi:hypothetical protein